MEPAAKAAPAHGQAEPMHAARLRVCCADENL